MYPSRLHYKRKFMPKSYKKFYDIDIFVSIFFALINRLVFGSITVLREIILNLEERAL